MRKNLSQRRYPVDLLSQLFRRSKAHGRSQALVQAYLQSLSVQITGIIEYVTLNGDRSSGKGGLAAYCGNRIANKAPVSVSGFRERRHLRWRI